MKITYYLPILCASMLAACEDTYVDTPDTSAVPLVVEGWIEEGEAPVVMVTHAADLTVDEPDFDNFVEKWCRVSIYDNDERFILTARLNKNYLPPLIFTHSRLKGKVGHTYRLVVETDDRVITAESKMLQAPDITSVSAMPVNDTDSLYIIRVGLDPEHACRYIKFFARQLPDEPRYYPTFLGTYELTDSNKSEQFVISRGKRAFYNDSVAETFSHYYLRGQTVMIKVCSLPEDVYNFWRIYDSNISLSDNLFFTFTGNLPGNIDGGLGYFAAYGSSISTIRIK